MKRKIIITADGSKTIHIEDWNEQYHSKHGAIQEAYHVFIDQGLNHYFNVNSKAEISILEVGFGTGLNAFITCLEAEARNLIINYVGIEGFPISAKEIDQLNYAELISDSHHVVFRKLHETTWENQNHINSNFILEKRQMMFSDISEHDKFDIIYFDAFGARVQPDLWDECMFKSMYEALKDKGVLVTYSAKGSVRRAMQAVGFSVERLQGPPGKRHMLRATK